MVGKDGEEVFGPPKIVPPMSKGFHHGKQLSFVDVVVAFGGGEGSGIVGDGVKLRFPFLFRRSVSVASFLGEHCSDPVGGGVSLQVEASVKVGLDEDWLSAHEGFKRLERFELGFSPVPDQILLG